MVIVVEWGRANGSSRCSGGCIVVVGIVGGGRMVVVGVEGG